MSNKSEEIQKLSETIRAAADAGNLLLIPRDKTLITIASLGITTEAAIEEIVALNDSDYESGPEDDRDRPGSGDIWIFKKAIMGYPMYIKLKDEMETKGIVKIISFHIDGA